MPHGIQTSRRWLALIVLCSGALMIVLDSTIVTVALPSIRTDLAFTETSLVWVVNAYLLTFGGFLLLGGRLGDLYGARRVFLIGMVAFTLASLACGLSTAQQPLIWARALQGLGGAVVDSVSFSLIINMFTQEGERAKAVGVYGFVCSAGGSIGALLGGALTTSFNWHWIFLVNLPLGVLVFVLCMWLIPRSNIGEQKGNSRLDVLGAVTVTAASMLAVYAFVNANEAGWLSVQSIGLLMASIALLILFVFIESRVDSPLVPLGIFRSRAVAVANIAALLWAASCFAWFFVCALYLQRMLGQDAMHVGLAFLPANVAMAVLALGLSARLVMRLGLKAPVVAGLLVTGLGLALFALAPAKGDIVTDVLPGMILFGLGMGIAFNPLLLCAMGGVAPSESGLASGLVNTSFMLGGALGLAILASAGSAWTAQLLRSGVDPVAALNSGYHVTFALGAACSVLAACVCGVLLPASSPSMPSPQSVSNR